MKKKFLMLILSVITCVTFIFGFAGCGEDDNPENKTDFDGNYTKTVLESDDGGLVRHYIVGNTGTGYGGEFLNNYTIDDLISTGLSYDTYCKFAFAWKSNKYKITKIEFDVTAESAFKTVLYVGNPQRADIKAEVELTAGQTTHVAMNCELKKNTGYIMIENYPVRGYYDSNCMVKWKLSNLFITAEKI